MKLFFLFPSFFFIFYSCNKGRIDYEINISVQGPYDNSEFSNLKDSIWLKKSVDYIADGFFTGKEPFYTVKITNQSKDTTYVAVSDYAGIIYCRYFCFQYLDGDFLVPTRGVFDEDDFMEWDPLLPNESKRYLTWINLDECELINLSLEVKSRFFDSLNLNSPVRYYWQGRTPIQLDHPVVSFDLENDRFISIDPVNVQKELNRTKRKLKIDD